MPLSSLNGWQRLGVFIATLIAVPSFLIGYQDAKSAHVYYDVAEWHQSLKGQVFYDTVYSDAYWKTGKLNGCLKSTIRVQPHSYSSTNANKNTASDSTTKWTNVTITCKKSFGRAAYDAKWFIIIPFMVVFGFGYVISWIVDGFRKRKK